MSATRYKSNKVNTAFPKQPFQDLDIIFLELAKGSDPSSGGEGAMWQLHVGWVWSASKTEFVPPKRQRNPFIYLFGFLPKVFFSSNRFGGS